MEEITEEEQIKIGVEMLIEKRGGLAGAAPTHYFALGTGFDKVFVGPRLLMAVLDELAEYRENDKARKK